jgi:hypothetical protein
VIDVEEEALAAIEEAEAKDVVPDKGEGGYDEDVVVEAEPGAAGLSFGDDDLSAQGAIAIHVLDVALNGGVGVVDEIGVKGLEVAVEGNGLMNGTIGEAGWRSEVGGVAAEEAELGIRVVATVANPAV